MSFKGTIASLATYIPDTALYKRCSEEKDLECNVAPFDFARTYLACTGQLTGDNFRYHGCQPLLLQIAVKFVHATGQTTKRIIC